MATYLIYAYQKPKVLVFISNISIKNNLMKSLSRILLAFTLSVLAFSSLSFAKNKKVVFLADKGKNTAVHAHESGNAILANALEESGLGFDTAQYKGWPTDAKAFDGADSVVIFCNGGKGHLVMKHLDQFEKLIDSGVGFVFMHYAVEVPEFLCVKPWVGILKPIGQSTLTGRLTLNPFPSIRLPVELNHLPKRTSGIFTCAFSPT